MTEERDPRISQRYRSLGSEAPSRELDQAILAAAHRALDRSHAPLVTPAGRHRWYFAFGAAAILVLLVTGIGAGVLPAQMAARARIAETLRAEAT